MAANQAYTHQDSNDHSKSLHLLNQAKKYVPLMQEALRPDTTFYQDLGINLMQRCPGSCWYLAEQWRQNQPIRTVNLRKIWRMLDFNPDQRLDRFIVMVHTDDRGFSWVRTVKLWQPPPNKRKPCQQLTKAYRCLMKEAMEVGGVSLNCLDLD